MIFRLSILLVMIALLAACGGTPAGQEAATPPAAQQTSAPATTEETNSPVTTEQTSTSATASAGAESAFPVNIAHKYGTTTIPAAPQRVVSLGYTDQDPILALGTKPVAVRYWFGDTAQAVWPWAQDTVGDAKLEILNMPFGELNIETIAALRPDLIVGVSSGITQEEYTTLSAIAPTVAQSADYVDFGVPWQEQTQVIGQALGQAAQAEALVADMEERFTQIRAEHPEFEGATAAIAAPAPDGQFYFSGPEHERQRYLSSLGFKLPDELTTIAGDAFYGTISGEQMNLLDTDVLIWTVSPEERATIESNPIYQQLDAVKAGRVIFLDTSGNGEVLGPALVYSSVLSLPLVHDQLVPQLAAALKGNAPNATATTTAMLDP